MSALLASLWPYLLMAVTVIGGAIGLYAKGRSDANTAAANRAMGRDLANRNTRNEVDRATAREPDPAGKLRDNWTRD